MLFNQLLDLIYHSQYSLSNDDCDLFVNMLGDKTEFIISDTNNILETSLQSILTNFIQIKKNLIKYNFLKKDKLSISEFTIINKDYYNTFDVCHSLNIYKYLTLIYFLDDNSTIIFFNTHTIHPSKGDVIIFPTAWFFVYKIIKKNKKNNNIYIFNNVLKTF
jgi:hypothetical protein